jgi:hypothetical protein
MVLLMSAAERARSRNQRRHKRSSHVAGVGLLHALAIDGLIEKEVRFTQQ